MNFFHYTSIHIRGKIQFTFYVIGLEKKSLPGDPIISTSLADYMIS